MRMRRNEKELDSLYGEVYLSEQSYIYKNSGLCRSTCLLLCHNHVTYAIPLYIAKCVSPLFRQFLEETGSDKLLMYDAAAVSLPPEMPTPAVRALYTILTTGKAKVSPKIHNHLQKLLKILQIQIQLDTVSEVTPTSASSTSATSRLPLENRLSAATSSQLSSAASLLSLPPNHAAEGDEPVEPNNEEEPDENTCRQCGKNFRFNIGLKRHLKKHAPGSKADSGQSFQNSHQPSSPTSSSSSCEERSPANRTKKTFSVANRITLPSSTSADKIIESSSPANLHQKVSATSIFPDMTISPRNSPASRIITPSPCSQSPTNRITSTPSSLSSFMPSAGQSPASNVSCLKIKPMSELRSISPSYDGQSSSGFLLRGIEASAVNTSQDCSNYVSELKIKNLGSLASQTQPKWKKEDEENRYAAGFCHRCGMKIELNNTQTETGSCLLCNTLFDDVSSLESSISREINGVHLIENVDLQALTKSVTKSPTVHMPQHRNVWASCTKAAEDVRETWTVAEAQEAVAAALQCPWCGKLFRSESLIEKHAQRFHPHTPLWGCDECGKLGSRKQNIIVHMRKRHPDKPIHMCRPCYRFFTHTDRHIRVANDCDTRPLIPEKRGPKVFLKRKTLELMAKKFNQTKVVSSGKHNKSVNSLGVTEAIQTEENPALDPQRKANHCFKDGKAGSLFHLKDSVLRKLHQRCDVRLRMLSRAEIAAAGLPADRPVASFAGALAAPGNWYPCFFCEGLVFDLRVSLRAHYFNVHFGRLLRVQYSTNPPSSFRKGPGSAIGSLTCRLCLKTFLKSKEFCYHVGVHHLVLEHLLPQAAWAGARPQSRRARLSASHANVSTVDGQRGLLSPTSMSSSAAAPGRTSHDLLPPDLTSAALKEVSQNVTAAESSAADLSPAEPESHSHASHTGNIAQSNKAEKPCAISKQNRISKKVVDEATQGISCHLCSRHFSSSFRIRKHYALQHYLDQIRGTLLDGNRRSRCCVLCDNRQFSSNRSLVMHLGIFHSQVLSALLPPPVWTRIMEHKAQKRKRKTVEPPLSQIVDCLAAIDSPTQNAVAAENRCLQAQPGFIERERNHTDSVDYSPQQNDPSNADGKSDGIDYGDEDTKSGAIAAAKFIEENMAYRLDDGAAEAVHLCLLCGYTSRFANNLRKHIAARHMDADTPCPHCGRVMQNRFTLAGHMAQAHAQSAAASVE